MAWTAPRTYTTGEIITAGILNTHLRDNTLALKDTWRHVIVRRWTGSGTGNAVWANCTWEGIVIEGWTGGVYALSNLYVPTAGNHAVTLNLIFTGGTGTGWGLGQISRYNSVGSLVENCGQGYCDINRGLSVSVTTNCTAGDFFQAQVAHSATGVAHTWTGNMSLTQQTVI